MLLAHICPDCGRQLARTRVSFDPVYGLPIVVCSCGLASVRRRHPLVVQWRRLAGAGRAFLLLSMQIAVLLGLSLGTAGFVFALEDDLASIPLSPLGLALTLCGARPTTRMFEKWLYDDAGLVFLILFGVVSLGAGMWLRGSLGHWRWPRPMAMWVMVVGFWIWFDLIAWPFQWIHGQVFSVPVPQLARLISNSGHLATLLLVSIGVSLVGAPLGRGVARAVGWWRGRAFMKRLNKRRRARRGE